MLPSSCLAFVAALCALLPEGAAFVAPINAATAVGRSACRTSSSRSRVPALKMAEEAAADGEPAGPTAADISKGIAHPEAVFTVPENILKVLPHRYPFALVDKVLHFEAGKRIIGIKCITNNEPQFTGHFPDLPIMPGVLQVCDTAVLILAPLVSWCVLHTYRKYVCKPRRLAPTVKGRCSQIQTLYFVYVHRLDRRTLRYLGYMMRRAFCWSPFPSEFGFRYSANVQPVVSRRLVLQLSRSPFTSYGRSQMIHQP